MVGCSRGRQENCIRIEYISYNAGFAFIAFSAGANIELVEDGFRIKRSNPADSASRGRIQDGASL
jgi:hypothetical protein